MRYSETVMQRMANTINIEYKDISELDTFTKYGDVFTKIWGDDEHHVYLFKRKRGYELVRGVKAKSDGTIKYRYPSNEQFGSHGWYIMESSRAKERINDLMRKKMPEIEEILTIK